MFARKFPVLSIASKIDNNNFYPKAIDDHPLLYNYSRVSNRRGSWQKSPKLINEEVKINGEASKNTAVRYLIEIKSSNDLVKISTKIT